MAINESAHESAQSQEPERVYRPDYIKVARAYEQRLAEAPDDAVLDTLRATLDAYEFEIRAIPRDRVPMYAFPDRLALAARMAGAFKPAERGELGDLMARLLEDLEDWQQATERRVANARRGCLPDGIEDAERNLRAVAYFIVEFVRDQRTACYGSLDYPTWCAEGNRLNWLTDRIEEAAEQVFRAVHGDDEPN